MVSLTCHIVRKPTPGRVLLLLSLFSLLLTSTGVSATRNTVDISITHSPTALSGDSNVTWTILVENASTAVPFRLLYYQLFDVWEQVVFQGQIWTNGSGYAVLKFYKLHSFIFPPDGNISLVVSIYDQDFVGQGTDEAYYTYKLPIDYSRENELTIWDEIGWQGIAFILWIVAFIPAIYFDKKFRMNW